MSTFPLQIEILPGSPAYEQVIQAVHRAMATGVLTEGDWFPSVRALSKSARINPNTAHKVVQALVHEGTLEVMPGRGTRIAPTRNRTASQRNEMIGESLDELVVEAKRLGFHHDELKSALDEAWDRLGGKNK